MKWGKQQKESQRLVFLISNFTAMKKLVEYTYHFIDNSYAYLKKC